MNGLEWRTEDLSAGKASFRNRYRIGDWVVDAKSRTLVRNEVTKRPTPRAIDVLSYLAERSGCTVSNEELLAEFWRGAISSPNAVYKIITELRQLLEGDAQEQTQYIETVPKRGYRLIVPTQSIATKMYALNTPSPIDRSSVPEKSIAVLPFIDMSERRDQQYLADGLTEEITYLLAKSSDLHVPARTSSFSFKKRRMHIREIAHELRVAFLLDGSIRRSDDRLRVTTQLVAGNGYQLWCERYERNVRDVFEVQDDVAEAIARELPAHMTRLHDTGYARGQERTLNTRRARADWSFNAASFSMND